jgi:hypothetical protein
MKILLLILIFELDIDIENEFYPYKTRRLLRY